MQQVSHKRDAANNNIANPAVTSSPESLQSYTGRTILDLCAMTDRTLAACGINPNLIRTCQFETPESVWGACDGTICLETATVYDRFTDRELCQFHFQKGAGR